jgi:hypothetical protein
MPIHLETKECLGILVSAFVLETSLTNVYIVVDLLLPFRFICFIVVNQILFEVNFILEFKHVNVISMFVAFFTLVS